MVDMEDIGSTAVGCTQTRGLCGSLIASTTQHIMQACQAAAWMAQSIGITTLEMIDTPHHTGNVQSTDAADPQDEGSMAQHILGPLEGMP